MAILLLSLAAHLPWYSAGQEDNRAQARQAVQTGVEQMRLGNLPGARIELQRAIHFDPNNPRANFELGLLFGQVGNVPAAAAALRKALNASPDWSEAHFNLGLTLVAESNAKRDWPGAIAEFRAALWLKPNYTEARQWLGIGLLETGERNAAITEFKQALQTDPASPELHLDFGRALQEDGDRGEAERELREALRLRPDYADAEIALGKLLSGDPDRQTEAIAYLQRAVRTNPDNASAQYAGGKALQKSGRTTDAGIAFRAAADIAKRQENMVRSIRRSNEGLDAAHKGDLEEALRSLQEAVDLCPNAAIPHYNLGLVLASRGEYQAARAQVIAAISLAPLEARFYKTLAQLWGLSGDAARSRAASERAAAMAGDAPHAAAGHLASAPVSDSPFQYGAAADTADAHFAFATFLAKSGDWRDAAGEWLRVLTLRPEDSDARNNLAVVYAHLGKDDAAELEFQKVLQTSSNSAAAHFGLAMLNLQHDKTQDAVKELREVVRINPDYPQAKTLLSNIQQTDRK